MKTTLRLLGLILLVYFVSCDPTRKSGATLKDDGVIEIVFLQMNDVYEISPFSDNTGGLARVAALRKSLLAKNPNTFTVLAGDFISPSVLGTLKHNNKRIRGKHMVETLNALGLDWVVLGNHEFDYDMEDLQARIDESRFTWLAGNARQIVSGQEKPFSKNTAGGGTEPLQDYLTLEVHDADGTTINLGVFGVLIRSGKKDYVQYSDPFDAAKKHRETLRPKTDVCIGLTHLDIADDKKLAEMLPDVPLIMGGHDHTNMFHRVGKTVVAKADANARTVYVHTLRYNKKTGEATVKSELRKIDGNIPNEPVTMAIINKWENIQTEALRDAGIDAKKPVYILKEDLDCRETVVRNEHAPVGGLITKAMLAAAKTNPDCAILNSGSIRVDDVLKDTLTELDIVRMLPFGGGIAEVEMRGSLLQQTLDAGVKNKDSGGWLQWGKINWNASSNTWMINGAPLSPAKIYKVVLPSFLLTGLEKDMKFLKTDAKQDGSGTTNPDVLTLSMAAPGDKNDLRSDIRLVLIEYLRTLKD